MTLSASPPISLLDVQAEFGAPPGTPLGDFLRGGAYVPNTPANAAVPAALPIALTDLLGASSGGGGPPPTGVNLADHFLSSSRTTGLARVVYTFDAAGTVGYLEAGLGGGSGVFPGEWLLSGAASAYEVRMTLSGGGSPTVTGITPNTWQNAAATWTAEVIQGGGVPAENFVVVGVEIRPAGGGATLATAGIEMLAERI